MHSSRGFRIKLIGRLFYEVRKNREALQFPTNPYT